MSYRDIEITVRKLLMDCVELQEYFKNLLGVDEIDLGERIRIGHVSTILDPVFPCITFKITSGKMDNNQFSVSPTFHLDIWSKDKIDTSQEIYVIIRSVINIKPISGAGIAQMIESNYEDALFEKSTNTHHVSAWYKVKAVNS